jgi:hypothetical protein
LGNTHSHITINPQYRDSVSERLQGSKTPSPKVPKKFAFFLSPKMEPAASPSSMDNLLVISVYLSEL